MSEEAYYMYRFSWNGRVKHIRAISLPLAVTEFMERFGFHPDGIAEVEVVA